MLRRTLNNKIISVVVFCLVFALSYSNAFAWGPRERRYHYQGGRWYGHGWFGMRVVVPVLSVGAIVDFLPVGYTPVIVGGIPYYYYDRAYYRSCPGGYVVVPAPVAVAPSIVVVPAVPAETSSYVTVIINVPNLRGGFNPVTLVKHGNGYIGPQGEYYPGHPTIEQLRVFYGN